MAKIDEHREYIGTVIENMDPDRAGRCKVKVAEFMEGLDENFIPWATPGMGGTFIWRCKVSPELIKALIAERSHL